MPRQDLRAAKILTTACELLSLMVEFGQPEQAAEAKVFTQGSFKVQGACDFLDVGKSTFRKAIKADEIPEGYMMCGCLHWNVEDLDAYRQSKSLQKGSNDVQRIPPKRRQT